MRNAYDSHKRDGMIREMSSAEADGKKKEIFAKLDNMSDAEISKLENRIRDIRD